MSRTTSRDDLENFTVQVPSELKAAFEEAAEAADRPAPQVLEDFMRAYVEQHQRGEASYDDWFRAQVQAAIDDPRPSIPHDVVMARTRSLIDRIATETPTGED